MAAQALQLQLQELRDQLDQGTPLSEEERASLHALAQEIEIRLASERTQPQTEDSLVDGVHLAVERFEVSHPNMAITLRNIMQSLASMGI
ncbi:DUF4404 family protein [Stutzerimonas tarimensis]|uniref:DUF4404 family protein n=1 Tax=Stutzerimonas tarimensis TaxID=1507735 RepID=A0ABV7T8I8_9GAMM